MPSNTLASRHTLLLALALFVSGCANAPPSCDSLPADPGQSLNRRIFALNQGVDDYLLAPVARGYRHLPGWLQQGVHNFVANFGEPTVFINDVLQADAERSVTTLGRFVINSTVGVLGLIDVSGSMGMERHRSDFGQTFGVWNIASGPTVELPLLGSTNVRDASGKVLGFVVDPLGGNSDTVQTLGTIDSIGGLVDGHAERLPLTERLSQAPDPYTAMRDYSARQRVAKVLEGKAGAPVPMCKG